VSVTIISLADRRETRATSPELFGLPQVNLEAVRIYANNLPVDQLEPVAHDAWRSAKMAAEQEAARLFYTVAFIASRIADERLGKRLGTIAG
jgi:hypothetical protein